MMTDLTDEVLENISAFKMEGFIAEENIVNAHIDATLRDFQIQMECERAGIVMESTSVIPQRNDENIFKYILCFIPRLIINLIHKLIEWISGVKAPDPEQLAKDREIAEWDGFGFNFANKVCDTINNWLRVGKYSKEFSRSLGYISYVDKRYVFYWRITNISGLINKYDAYYNEYVKYNEQFETLISDGALKASDNFVDFFRDSTTKLSDMIGEKVISNAPTNIVGSDLFTKDFIKLKKDLEVRADAIKKLMNQVIKKWDKAYKHIPRLEDQKLYIANEFLNSSRRLYDEFYRMNEVLMAEMGAGNAAFSRLHFVTKQCVEMAGLTEDQKNKLKERGLL